MGIDPTWNDFDRSQGEPTADGRQLKSLDRWSINRKGVTMHLDLWFDDAGEHATIARVSRHKRLWGMDTEKSVILPPAAAAPQSVLDD